MNNVPQRRTFRERLLKKWAKAVKCGICEYPAEPPFRLCRNGHRFCNRCRERMSTCPYCRASLERMITDDVLNLVYRGVRPPPVDRSRQPESSEDEEGEEEANVVEEAPPQPQENPASDRTTPPRTPSGGLERLNILQLQERIQAIRMVLPERLWSQARVNPEGGPSWIYNGPPYQHIGQTVLKEVYSEKKKKKTLLSLSSGA